MLNCSEVLGFMNLGPQLSLSFLICKLEIIPFLPDLCQGSNERIHFEAPSKLNGVCCEQGDLCSTLPFKTCIMLVLVKHMTKLFHSELSTRMVNHTVTLATTLWLVISLIICWERLVMLGGGITGCELCRHIAGFRSRFFCKLQIKLISCVTLGEFHNLLVLTAVFIKISFKHLKTYSF